VLLNLHRFHCSLEWKDPWDYRFNFKCGISWNSFTIKFPGTSFCKQLIYLPLCVSGLRCASWCGLISDSFHCCGTLRDNTETHCLQQGRNTGWTDNYLVHMFLFWPCCRCICKIAKRDLWLCCVHPSVRMEQLSSHGTDFHEIWYLSIFQQVWQVLYMKTNIHFFYQILLILLRMKNVSNKCCRKNQNTLFVCSNVFMKIMLFMRECGRIF
jgi:hypothetical protein